MDYNKSYEFLKDIREGWVQKGPHQRPYKLTLVMSSLLVGGPRMEVPEVMFPGPQDRAACSTLQRRPQASVLQLDIHLL